MIDDLLLLDDIGTVPEGAVPGAVAAGDLGAAVGLEAGGFALYDGAIGAPRSRRVTDVFDGPVVGVQVARSGVILLGSEPGSGCALMYIPLSDTDTHVPPFPIALGDGDWALVPGSTSDTVLVYDRSADTARGSKAIRTSTGELLWDSTERVGLRRVRWAGATAVGLASTGELVAIGTRSGRIEARRTLPPPPGGGAWTAWEGAGLHDAVIAGADEHAVHVVALDAASARTLGAVPGLEAQPRSLTPPRAADVLRMGDHLVVLLGADDEDAPCVAAVQRGKTWAYQEIDADHGACAVLPWPDGHLVQCGRRLRRIRGR